jgi:beta-glucosidase
MNCGLNRTFCVIAVGLVAGFTMLSPIARADDFDARARQIVAQMTLDEKISQIHGTSTKQQFRVVIGVPRLGIPDLLVTNGPAGFGPAGPGHSSKATALPSPLSLAATWDVDAARQYGVIAGSESADLGNMLLEAPDINIARIPQNGRTFEAYGEDPYLVGRLAVANIQGIQSQGIIANVKHFAANNQETNRMSVDAQVDERTLREIYLPAFEASVKEGHVASIMGAYNRLNGAYCCENSVLLNDILKKDWGFDGFVTSDFGAVRSTVDTATNGLDLEMPGGAFLGKPLKAAVDAGTVPVAVIDEHLIRRFRTMMKLGVWDHPLERKPIPETEHGEIAKKLGEEGAVLLRNEAGLLPLKAESIKSIALIGPYAGRAVTGGGGSSFVTPLHKITPLQGLQKRLGDKVKITVLDGKDIPASVAAAKDADVTVVMVGSVEGEGKDHTIALDPAQDNLVAAISDATKQTIVVITSGGPVLMPWVEKVPAILEAWYPGEEDGNVIAAVLMGDTNPSGKLPITFAKSLDDVPAHTPEQYPGTGEKRKEIERYIEGVLVGYRWYDQQKIEPLYPFGFGLSYTTFDYTNLKLSSETLSATAPSLTVDFDIANTGSRDGVEVAQVYVGMPALPGVVQPPRQLKGFAHIAVASGKSAHASTTLDARAFSYWDVTTHGWKIAPGDYSIQVGRSSRDIVLTGHVTIRE